MKHLVVVTGLGLLLGIGSALAQTGQPGQQSPGQAGQQPRLQQMTQAQCQQQWPRLTQGGQQLSREAAQLVVTNFQQADGNNDGQLSQQEFMQACERGLVQTAGTPGTGATGTGAGAGGQMEKDKK